MKGPGGGDVLRGNIGNPEGDTQIPVGFGSVSFRHPPPPKDFAKSGKNGFILVSLSERLGRCPLVVFLGKGVPSKSSNQRIIFLLAGVSIFLNSMGCFHLLQTLFLLLVFSSSGFTMLDICVFFLFFPAGLKMPRCPPRLASPQVSRACGLQETTGGKMGASSLGPVGTFRLSLWLGPPVPGYPFVVGRVPLQKST